MSIGIFDSGVGGLTVFREVNRLLPDQSITYLGDTLHLPYGEKSRAEIIDYSLQNVAFLLEQDIKLLVVACHTASAVAIEEIKAAVSIPVVNVVDCLVEAAASYQRVAIMGTRATIASNAIQSKLGGKNLLSLACPELVPIIEHGNLEDAVPALEFYFNRCRENKIDTILLACTHYPFLLPLMQRYWGDEFRFIDSAVICANQVASFVSNCCGGKEGYHEFFVTGDLEVFEERASKLLNTDITPLMFNRSIMS